MLELLEHSLRAHGGLSRWKGLHAIEARLSLEGMLFSIKGYPDGLRDIAVRVNTRRPETEIRTHRALGGRQVFKPDVVWNENAAGEVLQSLDDPRGAFAGQTRESPWDPMQLLYFTGYALWNYLTLPFLLTWPGFELEELDAHPENGERWRALLARFPANVPTHCREQVFYFDGAGLVRRHDYVTDLASGVAAHYPLDQTFHGIVFPTRHRVVPRTPQGAQLAGPSSVFMEIVDITIK